MPGNYAQRPAPLASPGSMAERIAQLELVIFGPDVPEAPDYIEGEVVRRDSMQPTGLVTQLDAAMAKIEELQAQLRQQQ